MDYSKESIKEGEMTLTIKAYFKYDSKKLSLKDAKEGVAIEVGKALLDSDLNYYISNEMLEITGTTTQGED